MDPATGSGLPWDKPDPGCQVPPGREYLMSLMVAVVADAVITPMPGIVCSRRLTSLARWVARMAFSIRLNACLQIIDLAYDQLDTAANRIGEDTAAVAPWASACSSGMLQTLLGAISPEFTELHRGWLPSSESDNDSL